MDSLKLMGSDMGYLLTQMLSAAQAMDFLKFFGEVVDAIEADEVSAASCLMFSGRSSKWVC